MNKLTTFFKRLLARKEKLYAEWHQRYFEIYCSNCDNEAVMTPDYSDYIYTRRCPHCKAIMKNWREMKR